MTEYKATGAQLQIPPYQKGIPYEEWLLKAMFPVRVKVQYQRKSKDQATTKAGGSVR